ncbi:MAG: hypothetical protein MSIBF_01190 [Candidatus Altiarchaeales archaeon IMC4]|nr:MAG: hypothetical protein MSIBF_01190 [Candidatus Altiarchaeales archaeon IMC4]
MKIQIYMCGEGLGHTSRCLAVGSGLINAGHDVSFHAYGSSKKHIEKNGFKATEIPSEIKLVGNTGSLNIEETIKATVKQMKPIGLPIVLNQIRKGKPDAIISDSYFLAVIAAKIRRVPVYLTVNQTNTSKFFENRGVRAEVAGTFMRYFMDIVFDNVEKVIIPDFPPPWTISKHNVEELGELLYYSGPLVREKPEAVKALNLKKPHILSLIGGFGYREKLLLDILEVARENTNLDFTLIAGPNVEPIKLEGHSDNVEIVGHIPNTFSYLKAADLVIAPGGHSTMMECMTYGVPLISFPDMNHGEQENNAEQLNVLNVGRRLSYHTPPFMISDVINDLLKDKEVKRNCRRLEDYSKKLDGPKRVVELIESRE